MTTKLMITAVLQVEVDSPDPEASDDWHAEVVFQPPAGGRPWVFRESGGTRGEAIGNVAKALAEGLGVQVSLLI